MFCQYCGGVAVFVDSSEVYNRSYGMIYLCRPCNAYVGVHKGTKTPLGILADKPLRQAKVAAHAAFDPLWKGKIERDKCSKTAARKAGYKWLADQLGIQRKNCHVGMFNIELCQRTVSICNATRLC